MGVTHAQWNLLRRIEHGNTPTAADRAVCPHGHNNAEGGGGYGDRRNPRRQFRCLTCGGRFSQLPPLQLTPGQDHQPEWIGAPPAHDTDANGHWTWVQRRVVQGISCTPTGAPTPPQTVLPNGILQVNKAPTAPATPPCHLQERPSPNDKHGAKTRPCVGDTKLLFHNRQGDNTDIHMTIEAL